MPTEKHCHFCNTAFDDITTPIQSPSGKFLACSKCWKEHYFSDSHGLAYLLKNGVKTDSGSLEHKKNVREFVSYVTKVPFYEINGNQRTILVGDTLFPVSRKDKIGTTTTKCRSCGVSFQVAGSISNSVKMEPEMSGRYGSSAIATYCNRCVGCLFPVLFDSVHEIPGSGRGIGVEIECEPSVASQAKMLLWKDASGRHVVCGSTDTSLRGKFPVEYKSPILHEDNYEKWIEGMGERLEAKVYNRCGLHIHISTKDFGWAQLGNVMRYCKQHENKFFEIVSPSRKPIGAGYDSSGRPMLLPEIFDTQFKSKRQLLSTLYGDAFVTRESWPGVVKNKRANDQGGPKYSGCINRYHWLNVHGHIHKGAIEIRLHHGTVEAEKIWFWIRLWLELLPMVANGYKSNPLDAVSKDISLYYQKRKAEFKKKRRSPSVKPPGEAGGRFAGESVADSLPVDELLAPPSPSTTWWSSLPVNPMMVDRDWGYRGRYYSSSGHGY